MYLHRLQKLTLKYIAIPNYIQCGVIRNSAGHYAPQLV
jgi:hypothetical protein